MRLSKLAFDGNIEGVQAGFVGASKKNQSDALYNAATQGHIEILQWLIEQPCCIKTSSLIGAMAHNKPQCVRILWPHVRDAIFYGEDDYGEDYFCDMVMNVITCRYTQVFYEVAGDFDQFSSHNQIKLLRQIQTKGCDELADMVVDVCNLHKGNGTAPASDILQIEAYIQVRKNIMQRAVLCAGLENHGGVGRGRKM